MSGGDRMAKICVLPGDGCGVEVTKEAVKALRAAEKRFGLRLELEEALFGGAATDAAGDPLPESTLALCRAADAVLLGAAGGPKWETVPKAKRPESGLLRLRWELQTFANLRPSKAYAQLLSVSPLKREVVEGADILFVREECGGLYYGQPKGITGARAVDTLVYDEDEIRRVCRVAFDLAEKRRSVLTSVDKANVLATSELWRATVKAMAKDHPSVKLNHLLVDTASMRLVMNPREFDVIVTENSFGDILTDEAAVLTGSIGLLPSACLGDAHQIYEPVHGSAPDIAGKDIANPLGAILSAALLCRYSLAHEEAASALERAVDAVLSSGLRTKDIAQPGTRIVGTEEMGTRVAERVLAER